MKLEAIVSNIQQAQLSRRAATKPHAESKFKLQKTALLNSIQATLPNIEVEDANGNNITLEKIHTPLGEFVKPESLHLVADAVVAKQDLRLASEIREVTAAQTQRLVNFINLVIKSEGHLGLKESDEFSINYAKDGETVADFLQFSTNDGQQFNYTAHDEGNSNYSMLLKEGSEIINLVHYINNDWSAGYEGAIISKKPELVEKPEYAEDVNQYYFQKQAIGNNGLSFVDHVLDVSQGQVELRMHSNYQETRKFRDTLSRQLSN